MNRSNFRLLPLHDDSAIRGSTRFEGRRGARLSCIVGSAWVTIDGEQRDVVLEPGESLLLDSDRLVLVQPVRAGAPIEMRLSAVGQPRRPPSGGWIRSLRAVAAGL